MFPDEFHLFSTYLYLFGNKHCKVLAHKPLSIKGDFWKRNHWGPVWLMINKPYLVHLFIPIIFTPAPPSSFMPSPLFYNSFLCMCSSCMSPFPLILSFSACYTPCIPHPLTPSTADHSEYKIAAYPLAMLQNINTDTEFPHIHPRI